MALAPSPQGAGGLFSALLCIQGPEQDGCLCLCRREVFTIIPVLCNSGFTSEARGGFKHSCHPSLARGILTPFVRRGAWAFVGFTAWIENRWSGLNANPPCLLPGASRGLGPWSPLLEGGRVNRLLYFGSGSPFLRCVYIFRVGRAFS